jgi:hypothetical protein
VIETRNIVRGRFAKVFRSACVALLNLWISSLIPQALIGALRGWTLTVFHSAICGTLMLAPGSLSPRLTTLRSRTMVVSLARTLEKPYSAARGVHDDDEDFWPEP